MPKTSELPLVGSVAATDALIGLVSGATSRVSISSIMAIGALTRAQAAALTGTAPIAVLTVIHGGVICHYQKDASGTALTTADGQNWSPLDGEPITPHHFGALADGTTDDSAAINLAFAYLKSVVATNQGGHMLFPPGVYKVQSSIGAHGIVPYTNAHITLIEGYGAKILVNTDDLQGKVILDLRGSTNIRVKGLEISSFVLSAIEPKVGLAWGRTSSTLPNNTDRNNFEDVRVTGRYSLAAAYNSQSEANGYYSCQFLNASSTTTSYGMVLDGINHFNVASDFTTLTLAVDTIGSFQTPVFVKCWFSSTGGGQAAIWLSSAVYAAKFISCYGLNTQGGNIFDLYVIDNTDAGAIKHLDCQEMHIESGTVANVFNITGPATSPIIQGLQYTDNYCFANDAIFTRDSTQTVTLHNLGLSIATFGASPDPEIFDDPSKYTVTPKIINLPSSYAWQFPSRTMIIPGNTPAITTVGSFTMAGLGADTGGSGANPAVFTPRISGEVRITITGAIRNSVALSGAFFRIQYGTGTAPAANDATTGSTIPSFQNQMISATANQVVPFHLEAVVSGRTLGTEMWVDLGIRVITSGNVFVEYPTVAFEEII